MSENQNSATAPQSTIDPMYRNLARGETVEDRFTLIHQNALYIDTLCDLMESFDTSITIEPLTHATHLIQRLAREITINNCGNIDAFRATGGLS